MGETQTGAQTSLETAQTRVITREEADRAADDILLGALRLRDYALTVAPERAEEIKWADNDLFNGRYRLKRIAGLSKKPE